MKKRSEGRIVRYANSRFESLIGMYVGKVSRKIRGMFLFRLDGKPFAPSIIQRESVVRLFYNIGSTPCIYVVSELMGRTSYSSVGLFLPNQQIFVGYTLLNEKDSETVAKILDNFRRRGYLNKTDLSKVKLRDEELIPRILNSELPSIDNLDRETQELVRFVRERGVISMRELSRFLWNGSRKWKKIFELTLSGFLGTWIAGYGPRYLAARQSQVPESFLEYLESRYSRIMKKVMLCSAPR